MDCLSPTRDSLAHAHLNRVVYKCGIWATCTEAKINAPPAKYFSYHPKGFKSLSKSVLDEIIKGIVRLVKVPKLAFLVHSSVNADALLDVEWRTCSIDFY